MMNKSQNQNDSPVSSVFQTPLPSTTFSFKRNPSSQQNMEFVQPQQSFASSNSVFGNVSQFPQNNFSFSNTSQSQALWNNQASFSNQTVPSDSQINTFSFKSNKPNEQNVVANQTPFAFASNPNAGENETDSNYSKLGELPPECLQAFQAKTFKYGHIPLQPPPKELCL